MQQVPIIWGHYFMRAAAVFLVTLLLAGCASEAPVETPAMYVNMAEAGARLDPAAAASMISQYRQNNGLGGVEIRPPPLQLQDQRALAVERPHKLDPDLR